MMTEDWLAVITGMSLIALAAVGILGRVPW